MALADAAVEYVVGRVSSLTGAPLAESPAARRVGLQPGDVRVQPACIGLQPGFISQQPPFRMVAASVAYGCRPGDPWLGVVQRAARRPATRGLLTLAPPRRKARPAPRPNLPYSLVLTTHCSLTHESLLTLTTHYSPLTTTHSLLTTVRRTTTTYYYDVLLRRTTEQAREAPRPEPPAADRF